VLAASCTYLLVSLLRQVHRDQGDGAGNNRATPAERLRNGHDFEPTNKWIVFGHHFAAIAGPGPWSVRSGAQFGYLPGTLWIIIGGFWAALFRIS